MSLALVIMLLGACGKDPKDAPQTQERHYTQMSISLELDTQVEAFSNQTPQEPKARAATFDMGTKGSLTSPKFKELEDGTKLLCIIRSSNPDQPINYVQAEWKRSGNRYYLKYEDGNFPFQYDTSKPLGTLYAMLVAGGEWDATNKRLSFSNRITPIKTVGGKEVATLDVPYFSAWEELEVQTPGPAGLAVRLKDYKTGLSTEPAFVLKPQGMLLRMRVENEMENPVNGKLRAAKLNKLYIRSTAYSGNGYYDLSEAQVREGAAKAAKTDNEQLLPWMFSDAEAFKTTIFTFTTPLELSTDATSTPAGSVRGMKDYPNSPWVLAWVKATDQPASLIGQEENNLPKVRTEILAEVEDSRSNTVYSNKDGVDAEEAAGKIVVPSMKALPVYSSMRLTTKSGANAAFVNGTAYSLTINVQRMPLLLERISEYEVKQSGSAFTDKTYTDVGYFSRAELMTGSDPDPSKIPLIGNKDNTTWDYPDFELMASIMGISRAVIGRLGSFSLDDTKLKYPTILSADGDYKPYSNSGRYWLGLTHKEVNGKIEAYTLTFYPNERKRTDKTARYASIVKYEYDRTDNGLVIMKMTQRYLGTYSLWAAHFPDNTPTGEYKDRLKQDMEHIMKLGDAFWNDPLRKADDIVRYFPLLGYKYNHQSSVLYYGDIGYTIMGITGGNNKYGSAAYSTSLLTHDLQGQVSLLIKITHIQYPCVCFASHLNNIMDMQAISKSPYEAPEMNIFRLSAPLDMLISFSGDAEIGEFEEGENLDSI